MKVYKKFFDMSHPKWNYLGHFKEDEFLKQGHNDSADWTGIGMSVDEAASHKERKSFQDSFNAATGGSSDAKEDTRAADTEKQVQQSRKLKKTINNGGYGY